MAIMDISWHRADLKSISLGVIVLPTVEVSIINIITEYLRPHIRSSYLTDRHSVALSTLSKTLVAQSGGASV
jgi:hypothetical protein